MIKSVLLATLILGFSLAVCSCTTTNDSDAKDTIGKSITTDINDSIKSITYD